MILAHGTSTASRKIALKKAGSGQLTLAGVVGLQTSGAGGTLSNHVVDVEVLGGTLVMTANNTTYGTLAVRTNAVLKMQNGSAGTSFTGGNSAMTGTYTVDAGATLQGFRNGTAAFGTGAIILNGGKLAQEQGNWTWANNIVLGSGFTSTLESQSGSGSARALKLQGVVSGDGNLVFSDTTGYMTADTGFIFTGTNTLSGTVTIPVNHKVRVGGAPGSTSDLGAGAGGTLGTAAVVNNGTLTFSRSDAHTFANAISGSGNIRVGSTGISGSGTQVLTLTGENTYSGGTGVNTGALLVNGSHVGGSLYAVGTNCTLGGSGTITVAGGGSISLQPGATLAPGAAPGAGGTLTLNTLSLSNAVTIAIDAPTDAVVVTGDLALSDNAVTVTNSAAFSKTALYPILSCQGTVTGTLPSRIPDTHWFIRRDGNTFYLQYNYGTLISVL
jgi:autotransporter-associated beta strand protein